jgi:hypothetical protein
MKKLKMFTAALLGISMMFASAAQAANPAVSGLQTVHY